MAAELAATSVDSLKESLSLADADSEAKRARIRGGEEKTDHYEDILSTDRKSVV